MSPRKKIMAITPIMCLIIYLSLGFLIKEPNMWGWGLFIFLLVPIMPYLIGLKKLVISVSAAITIVYVVVGILSTVLKFPDENGLWHPLWIIFLLIPVIHILITPNKKKEEKKEPKKEAYVDVDNNTYDAK